MARKRINKNMIVALTLFCLAMVVVLAALMLRQVKQRDPTYFVELAKQSEAQGDMESAVAFFGKAWERSNDAEYLVEIGRLFVVIGDLRQAVLSWQTALINDPNLTEAHTRLLDLRLEMARLYDRTDDWKAIRDSAQAFLDAKAGLTTAVEARTRYANGLALIRLARLGAGNAEAGEADLIQAMQLDPDGVDYALDLARHYVASDRLSEAERLFEATVSANSGPGPAATKARTALAVFLASHDRFEEAGTQFEQSLAQAEGVPEALSAARHAFALLLAQRWFAARERTDLFERAESLLKESIADSPLNYAPYVQLGSLYGAARRHMEVCAICDQRLALGLDRSGIRGARNRLDSFSLMIFASEACISEATVKHEAGDETARQEWLARAEQYIASARSELPSNPRTFVQSARVKVARGLDRQALDDLRAAQEGYNAAEAINWDNTILLARLHLRLNEPGAAQAVLDEVLEAARRDRSDDTRFWTLYAQVLFQGRQLDRALAMVNRILQGAPGNADAKALQFAIYEKQGRKEEALRSAEAITDDPATVRLIEARGLLLESDYTGALAAVKRGLIDAPAHEKLVRAAVRILLDLDRAEEARDIVEAALRIRPDDTKLQLHLALTRDDLSPAERDAAILKYIDQEKDAYQRTLELIGFYLGKNDRGRLLALLDEAIGHLTTAGTPSAQRAASSQLRILLETKVSVASSLGDTEAMFRVRDLATELNVDGADGKSFEGIVFMHLEDYEAAIDSLREASAAQPTDGRLLARLGRCYQILDRQDEAEAFYHRALQVNSEQKSAHKGLAMLAKGRGDEVAYEHHFSIAEPLLADDPWIRAQRLEREEKANPLAAISRRKEERLEDPQDVENLIRLAGLYETVGDADHASEVYTTALASAPSHKALVASAAGFFRRANQGDSAVEVIARYIQSQSEADEKARGYLLLASHFLHLDTLDRAEAALHSALQASESLEVIETLAEFYLRSAKRPDQAMHWADKAAAIARSTQSARLPRILAMRVTCQLQPELDDIDKAQRYCDELLMDHPDYQPALLLLSEIKSRQGDIGAAISTISDYLSRFPDDPKALYQRAVHHLARGRSGSAIEDLEHLKRRSPLALDLRPRLLLARLKRSAGRPDQAIRELETLLEDVSQSMPALEALVLAYMDEGRYADAVRRVTARINRAGENPQARWLFLRAQAVAQLDDFGAALADVQRGAEIEGHDALSMMRVLDLFLRAGWASDGAAYFLEHATTQAATPALASRYARVLLAAGRDAEAVDQFRRAMAAALDQTADVVRIVSADLSAAFRGREAARNAIALFEQSPPAGAMGRVNDRIRVRLYRLVPDTGAAAAILIKLVDSTKDNRGRALLYHELGDLYQRGNLPLDARDAYEEALKYDPDYWITLNNLAYVLSEDLSETELALEYAGRAVAARDTADTRDTLGWIHVKLGNPTLAIASLSKTVRGGSADPWHYYHLGEAYRRDGQHGEASGILQTGRRIARQRNMQDLGKLLETSIDRNTQRDSAP